MAENSGKTATREHRGRPFRPGESGNPGGRPKVTTDFRDWCRAFILNASVSRTLKDGTTVMVSGRDLLAELASSPGEHQFRALRYICDQGYGQPTRHLEAESEPIKQLVIHMGGKPDDATGPR